jgi:hypothetical protein
MTVKGIKFDGDENEIKNKLKDELDKSYEVLASD